MRANIGFAASLQVFGRGARSRAASSALFALYQRRPLLRSISRLTVDGARPSCEAIVRIEWPATKPREISSRSAEVSARRERRFGGGQMSPVLARAP